MAGREDKPNPKERRDETSVEKDTPKNNTSEQTPKPEELDIKELSKVVGGAGSVPQSW